MRYELFAKKNLFILVCKACYRVYIIFLLYGYELFIF